MLVALAALWLFSGCAKDVVARPDDPATRNHVGSAPAPKTDFSGERAFEHLRKQCGFGVRVPGTGGWRSCQEYIVTTLKSSTPDVQLQPFEGAYRGKRLKMNNIIARFNPEAKTQIVICAHWDTRPTADEDVEPSNRGRPILGANDGASGVAVLLELARVLKERPVSVGVTLAFWDGEDLGPGIDNMLLGARHWAKRPIPANPSYVILLDMIGDSDLRVPVEPNSRRYAPAIIEKVYKMAGRLNLQTTFPYEEGPEITDDHIPINEAGIKAIDLIDFDYPPWHTLADTVDKCSAASLAKVGTLVEAVLREEK